MDYGSTIMSERDQMVVADTLRMFDQLQVNRSTFNSHWEETAELILPTSRNTFNFGNVNTPGEKKTDFQVDSNGMVALGRFAAICDSLLTPRNTTWHGLEADDDYVMKDRATRLWFEDATRLLFKKRYAPIANFSSQNQNVFTSLGAFGTASMFIDKLDDGTGWRYKALPLGETYFYENHQGIITGMIRVFRLTALQASEVPEWKDRLPECIKVALTKNTQQMFNFIHHVGPRGDFDPTRWDERGKPFISIYICLEGRCIMQEGGYNSFPVAATRYEQTPNEVYGRGPAMKVLPALKTLNAEKKVFLKQGHRAGDPVYLMADEGMLDGFNVRPGAMNPGTMSQDGKRLVDILPAGDIQITEEMMKEEISLIKSEFLVDLFQILTETPTMTATEVIERTNEKGILLAPTVGRQNSEYLYPMIERELDLAMELRLLPPMPPRLREAQGEYKVVFTSPMAKAARAQEVAGFSRSLQMVQEIVKITGDPEPLDHFEWDTIVPGVQDITGMLPSWTASPEKVAQKREARAKARAQEMQIQAAPAAAAMKKANVAEFEAGMQQQQ